MATHVGTSSSQLALGSPDIAQGPTLDDSYLVHTSAARASEGAECRERLLWLGAEACKHILEIVKHSTDGHCVEQVSFVEACPGKSLWPFVQGQNNIERGKRYIRRYHSLLHCLKAEG